MAADNLIRRVVHHGDGVLEDSLAAIGLHGIRGADELTDSTGILCSLPENKTEWRREPTVTSDPQLLVLLKLNFTM